MRHDKLIRDGIPAILNEKGIKYSSHLIVGKKYEEALKAKLIEEVYEFVDKMDPEEMADVETVLDTIYNYYRIDRDEVRRLKESKLAKRGGFEKGIFLDETHRSNSQNYENCFFCKTYHDGKEVFSENQFFYSRFDRFPVEPGHLEVIPKRHFANLDDMTQLEWNFILPMIKETVNKINESDLRKVYKDLQTDFPEGKSMRLLEEALNSPFLNKTPDARNHFINDGRAAGRTIDHFHWHILPRYNGDVENPRGGGRHIIPGKGSY